MIKVSSTVQMDMGLLQALAQAQITALEQTAEALHTEVVQARVVPRMDGTLQGEGFFVDASESHNGEVSLVHSTPYARRMYFHPEYDFHRDPWEEKWTDKEGVKHHVKHDGNPNAQGKWLEPWISGAHKDFCQKTFAEIYRRITGL